jgi:hypothetical protein
VIKQAYIFETFNQLIFNFSIELKSFFFLQNFVDFSNIFLNI